MLAHRLSSSKRLAPQMATRRSCVPLRKIETGRFRQHNAIQIKSPIKNQSRLYSNSTTSSRMTTLNSCPQRKSAFVLGQPRFLSTSQPVFAKKKATKPIRSSKKITYPKTFTKETLGNIFDFKKAEKKKERKKFPVIATTNEVPHLGLKGEIKLVSKGYYRNYLFPKMLAVRYSEEARKMIGDPDYKEIEEREEKKRQKAAVQKMINKEIYFVKMSPNEKNLVYPLEKSDIARRIREKFRIDLTDDQVDLGQSGLVDTTGYSNFSIEYEGSQVPMKVFVKRHGHTTDSGSPPKAEKPKPRRQKRVEGCESRKEEMEKRYGGLIDDLNRARLQRQQAAAKQ